MLHVVLYQPEIPPNTGNIMRLCANTGAGLHLIGPLGFEIDDKRLRRAGMDYRDWAEMRVYTDLLSCLQAFDQSRIFVCTTKASRFFTDVSYQDEDVFLFGPETRGLPQDVRKLFPEEQWLRVPMLPASRSLNLANSVGVFVYEAWRQLGFQGAV